MFKNLFLQSTSLLTAGGAGAVDGRHPQVGGAGVHQHGEGLTRGSDGDHAIVGELRGTRT